MPPPFFFVLLGVSHGCYGRLGCYCHYWRRVDSVLMRSVLYFLIGFLIAINAVLASAAGSCPPEVQYRTLKWDKTTGSRIAGEYGPWSSSKESACSASGATGGVSGNQCAGECTWTCYGWSEITSQSACPYGTNADGSCKCPDPCSEKAGFYDNGGNPQMVKLPGSSWYEGKGSAVPETMCIDGCTAGMKQNLQTQVTGGGYWGAETNPVYTGQSCGTSSATDKRMPKDSEEKKCVDSGKAFGYVNDKVVCVSSDTKGGTATKKTETKNADGTTTKTETTTNISCNAQGACSTTTTTTTTVINSDGTTASTKTETKKEDSGGGAGTGTAETSSFCKDNPSSPMCKTGTFTGTCSQVPECTGDPIQCATAKATFKANCALEVSPEVATKGQSFVDGTDQETKDALGRKEIVLPQVNASDSGGGACPADRQFELAGQSISIPFSSICGYMVIMKIALLAIASFSAAMIITGGVK